MSSKAFTTLGAIALSTLFFAGCSSSSNNNSTGPVSGSFTVKVNGGSGGANGGAGGGRGLSGPSKKSLTGFNLAKYYGTGNIELLKTGLASDSYEIPSIPVIDLGETPLLVMSDMTISVFENEPALGVAYSSDSSLSTIYISDGDNIVANETPITGISIDAGVTLTLAPNATDAMVNVANDIQNNGVITSTFVELTYRNIDLAANHYFGGAESAINTHGTSSVPTPGSIAITTTLAIYNQGALNASGADITSPTNGATISLTATDDAIYNSGQLISRGGSGISIGGNGGEIFLNSDFDIINSGDISAQGGSSEVTAAGNAGSLSITSSGKQLINTGNLTLTGGNTDGGESNAGIGGVVNIAMSPADSLGSATDGIKISGNMDVSGGNVRAESANDGGSAGTISIVIANAEPAGSEAIQLLGYSMINLNGGDANFPGHGNGVSVFMTRGYASETASHGNIINEVDITSVGGNVVDGAANPAVAGAGGSISMSTQSDSFTATATDLETIINSGKINISAGRNTNIIYIAENIEEIAIGRAPGISGKLAFSADNNVQNTGVIIANGSSNVSESGKGYNTRGVNFTSFFGEVNNTANITSNGGDGSILGGKTRGITFTGQAVTNDSAALTARGGNADVLLAGSQGGQGGAIRLESAGETSNTLHTGTVDHSGGTGETAGIDGAFFKDGVLISGRDPAYIKQKLPF